MAKRRVVSERNATALAVAMWKLEKAIDTIKEARPRLYEKAYYLHECEDEDLEILRRIIELEGALGYTKEWMCNNNMM